VSAQGLLPASRYRLYAALLLHSGSDHCDGEHPTERKRLLWSGSIICQHPEAPLLLSALGTWLDSRHIIRSPHDHNDCGHTACMASTQPCGRCVSCSQSRTSCWAAGLNDLNAVTSSGVHDEIDAVAKSIPIVIAIFFNISCSFDRVMLLFLSKY
jgi:hypothetical protein